MPVAFWQELMAERTIAAEIEALRRQMGKQTYFIPKDLLLDH